MTDGLGPEARALIERAIREEDGADPAELARIRRRVLASGVGAGVLGAAGEAVALKGQAALVGVGSIIKAALLGGGAAALAVGMSYVWRPLPVSTPMGSVSPGISRPAPSSVRTPANASEVTRPAVDDPEPARLDGPSRSSRPAVRLPARDAASIKSLRSGALSEPTPEAKLPERVKVAAEGSGSASREASLPRRGPNEEGPSSTSGVAIAESSGAVPGGGEIQRSPGLVDELTLLERVQSELRASAGARALELLDRNPARSSDQLRAERLAAEVFASCQARQVERARRAASRFLRDYPSTPAAARVRASCGGDAHVADKP